METIKPGNKPGIMSYVVKDFSNDPFIIKKKKRQMKTYILKGSESKEQYQDLKFLTNGGMGSIYSARDVIKNEIVALKIIRIENPEDRKLLNEEFAIAASLFDNQIIRTYYYSEFNDETGDYFYSVMEHCAAGSLRSLLNKTSDFFPLQKCVSYFFNLLNALQYAHNIIVHRDLKPENILIGNDGSLKICDFGISKYIDKLTRTRTYKGSGTLAYMPPECWTFDHNTPQMDIYSLGIIFFEILTLQQPFQGKNEKEYRDQHLFSMLPSPSIIRPDTPVPLVEIIRKMTNKRPSDRFKNIAEILTAMAAVIAPPKMSLNIQSVLEKAQQKSNNMAEKALKLEKTRQENEEKERILNFSLDQLFDEFIKVADISNEQLISEKITCKKFKVGHPIGNTFRLNFFNATLTISCFNVDIQHYIESNQQRYFDLQQRQYGYIMQDYTPEFIERDKVILVGKAALTSDQHVRYAGFNVVLLKINDEDIYGHWWICKFYKNEVINGRPTNFYYPLDPPEFFTAYNEGRGNVISLQKMSFSKLKAEDIVDLISFMPDM